MGRIRNIWEKWAFKFKKMPTWEQAIKFTPDGDYTKIDASNITLGNMNWKAGYTKNFDPEGEDPMFRPSRPWDSTLSSPDNIKIEDGLIKLTQPAGESQKDAWMESNFKIKYGTIRALIKLPKVDGAWSAFWLFGTNGMPEMDILEHCGSWENEVAVTHHWGYDYNGERGKKSTLHNGRKKKKFKPTDEYYLYEVELSPYYIKYKINGVVVRKLKNHLSSGENTIIFDVTTGFYCNSSEVVEDATMLVKFLEIYKIH
jgi:hypothetical protein